MTGAKRYTLIDGRLPLPLSAHPTAIEEAALTHSLFTGEKQVVLASDYDALAAELADWQGQASSARVVIAALDARIATLEEALRVVRAKLQPYTYLPSDAFPGPPLAIIDVIDAALAAPKEEPQ